MEKRKRRFLIKPGTSHPLRENLRLARRLLGGTLPTRVVKSLETLSRDFSFSLSNGELQFINSCWYVTHTGLLGLARRKRCRGIHVEAVDSLCESQRNRFVLKATVFPSRNSSGFVGYGDADPSNVSPLVRGAEMRVAETRAVNRALRMRRQIAGLHAADRCAANQIPEGGFLVRVQQVHFRRQAPKPYYTVSLVVIEPNRFASHTISSRLYCNPKALWKLNWFLRDFGYDTDLLGRDEVDETQLIGLKGVVKISHIVLNGTSLPRLDGFAPASRRQELSSENLDDPQVA